jgi:hypothetical protein
MLGELLDDFCDPSAWVPVASGQAHLDITSDRLETGDALRLDFDFRGGGGFVVARRAVTRDMPESFSFHFRIRGDAPLNKFEFKLCDPSGRNVWWFHRDPFPWPADWQEYRIDRSQIEFAWGPRWGEELTRIGALELVIAAGEGGAGTVWLADLRLQDHSKLPLPRVQASGSLPGCPPSAVVMPEAGRPWHSDPADPHPWISLDFGEEREYGGIVVDWLPGRLPLGFQVEVAGSGEDWSTVYQAPSAGARASHVYLPACRSRRLRLRIAAGVGGVGIRKITVKSFEYSRSLHQFFQQVARAGLRGHYPRYWLGEQSYWSPVGTPAGPARGLLNEEGMAEIAPGGFSVEPFLWLDGTLLSWNEGSRELSLERGYLPIPSVKRQTRGLRLTTTLFADRVDGCDGLYLRYRVENLGAEPLRPSLFTALRPFQVTPPWQAFNRLGGASPIETIDCRDGTVKVNGDIRVIALQQPDGCGAAAFAQGNIAEFLAEGRLPRGRSLADPFGHGSAALRFDLELAPGGCRDFYLLIPYDADAEPAAAAADGPARFAAACGDWAARLNPLELTLPGDARPLFDTYRTALAHILIHRDGPALQPGPRRYTRSWVRDGAIMAAALLRNGCADAALDFVRWYAGFQRGDGLVPCCVDHGGPDWLIEYDSLGEWLFVIMECYRYTGDSDFLAEQWPGARRAVDCIERLCATRLTGEYRQPDRLACFGLLPESASHEGYLAHPVHAYWDDFWALRGLKDAVTMAENLGFAAEAARIGALRETLRGHVYASLQRVMAERGLDYLPGSVEWADCDPSATAVAVAPVDELADLPRQALERTFAIYLERFRDCRSGKIDWPNYTAYEIRIIPALVRLGKRREALELVRFFIGDRRPLPWNQWPEISWRDPESPGHIGDVPHTWISAEYVLAFLALFAYDRDADQALVVGAGLPAEWLQGDGISVRNLHTRYGMLDFSLRLDGDFLEFRPGNRLTYPPGGILLQPPVPFAYAEADGVRLDTADASGVRLTAPAATVRVALREG